MVNEEQQLEACLSLERYYTRKFQEFREAGKEYDEQRYLQLLAYNDVRIYDLEQKIKEKKENKREG